MSPGVSASLLGGSAKSARSRPAQTLLQPDIGAPFHRGVIGDDGEIGMRDPRGTADEAARRDGRAAVVGFGVGVS